MCVCVYIAQGLYGALFIWCNIRWTRVRRKFFSNFPFPVVEVLSLHLCGCGSILVALWRRHVHNAFTLECSMCVYMCIHVCTSHMVCIDCMNFHTHEIQYDVWYLKCV